MFFGDSPETEVQNKSDQAPVSTTDEVQGAEVKVTKVATDKAYTEEYSYASHTDWVSVGAVVVQTEIPVKKDANDV